MAKNRPSGQKYKQSSLKSELFRHIFRTMYSENTEYIPEKTISRSEYEKLDPFEQVYWYYGKVVPDEEYTEPAPRKLWNNTIKGLTEDLKNGHLGILERMGNPNSIYAFGNKEPKINQDNVRNAVDELVSEGLLVRYQAAHNQNVYYPNESLEGFRSYIRWMKEHKDNTYGYLFLTNTLFYRRMLDRQLVLDVLKENDTRFVFTLMSKKGESYRFKVPIVGRFPKIYEMRDCLESYITTLENLNECLESVPVKLSRVYEILYETELRPEDEAETILEDTSALEEMSRFTEGLIGYLKDSLEKMDYLDSKSTGGTFGADFTLREQFAKDGGFIFRREALWEDMILEGNDRARLKKETRIVDENGNEKEVPDWLMESVLIEYPSIMEEQVVLPVLCLVEMSPLAMERFFLVPDAIRNQVFSLNTRDYGICDENGNPFFDDSQKPIPGFAVELDKLLSEAQRDYVNHTTLYQTHEFIANQGNSKTSLYRLGEISANGDIYPALFTFRINDGRYLAMYHSLTMDPIVPLKREDYVRGPEGVPESNRPTYLYGERWKTPEWLIELLEGYIELYDRSKCDEKGCRNILADPFFESMRWFKGLLKHNLHTDWSLMPAPEN